MSAKSNAPRPFGKSVTGGLLKPGETVGDYSVAATLVVTLFGALYQVRDGETGAFYLMHVLPEDLKKDKSFRDRLEDCMGILRDAKSEVILKPLSVHDFNGRVAVLYESAEVITFGDFVSDKGGDTGLAEDEIKFIFGSVASALDAAAVNEVYHLNLTPDFILMTGDGRVKVWGFGVFQSLERRRFELFVSSAIVPIAGEENAPLTSLDVLSPEIRNGEEGGLASDQFSLGICLYFSLTGQRPERDWVVPSVMRDNLSEGWDVFVSTCLEPRPQNRFPDWKVFQRALRQAEKYHQGEGDARGRFQRKLEYVPLPKRVTDHYSPKTQQHIRLVLLLVFGFVVVSIGAWSYRVLTDPGPPAPTIEVQEVASESEANFILDIRPVKARVELRQGEASASVFVESGEAYILLPRGSYHVRVDASQHEAQNFMLEVGQRPVRRRITLDPEWARLEIRSRPGAQVFTIGPEGAEAYVDEIPENGTLRLEQRLLAGRHTLRVEKPGFEPMVWENARLSASEPTVLEASLTPEPAVVRVTSEPEGLEVWIDGTQRGVTPAKIEDLEPGVAHTVELRGAAIETASRTVELRPGAESLVEFTDIEALTGELRLHVQSQGEPLRGTDADGLRVTVDDRSYNDQGSISTNFVIGTHAVEVTHRNYFPASRSVTIREGETTDAVVELKPRPARLTLDLPADTKYVLTGSGGALEPVEGAYEFEAGVDHELRLIIRDYLALVRTWNFDANESVVWKPELRAIPEPTPGDDYQVPYTDLRLAWIPSGTFQFGSDLREELRTPNEDEPTRVRFERGFWISEYEVTQDMYSRFVGGHSNAFPGAKNPVENVSWHDAMEFCALLNRREKAAGRLPKGYVYRLPTEAEWEYAARAGTSGPFHFGSTANPKDANLRGNYPPEHGSTSVASERQYGTRPVGSYEPNAWGLYDVHGNVREWVYDFYNDRHPGGLVVAPVVLEGARGRAIKGGGWEDFFHRGRSAARERASEGTRADSLGFRIALAPEIRQ